MTFVINSFWLVSNVKTASKFCQVSLEFTGQGNTDQQRGPFHDSLISYNIKYFGHANICVCFFFFLSVYFLAIL